MSRIEEIRERLERSQMTSYSMRTEPYRVDAAPDLRFLLADRDRLAAEVEDLRLALSDMREALVHAAKALEWDAVMECALIADTLRLHARLSAPKGGGV